jgi:hypothetical protein
MDENKSKTDGTPSFTDQLAREQDATFEALAKAVNAARWRAHRLEQAMGAMQEAAAHRMAAASALVFPGADPRAAPLLNDRALASHRYAMHLANKEVGNE